MNNCTDPQANDSEFDLLWKILVVINSKVVGGVPDCNQPMSGDSEWDLLSKILKSVALL